MKRSEINAAISQAKVMLEDHGWFLPDWAGWNENDFAAKPDVAEWLKTHQLGWDVTDFGSGDFARRGLGLFCLRNGIQSDGTSLPYAEKLLFVGEDQETPFHTHRFKLEDIINRGGGDLVLEFRHADGRDDPIELRCDGALKQRMPDEPLILSPGQSVTVPRGIYHRFYAKPGKGMVLGGEVSQVNDDNADNYFLEPLGRFSEIDEDEPRLHTLWNDIGAVA